MPKGKGNHPYRKGPSVVVSREGKRVPVRLLPWGCGIGFKKVEKKRKKKKGVQGRNGPPGTKTGSDDTILQGGGSSHSSHDYAGSGTLKTGEDSLGERRGVFFTDRRWVARPLHRARLGKKKLRFGDVQSKR